MSRTSLRAVAPARRIPPQIPPLVDRLIFDLVNVRQSGDEADVAEINGHGISGTEHQFGRTNHFTARTLLATFAVYGPERSCEAANPTLREVGLVLSPLPAGRSGDPACALLDVVAQVGELAREHAAAFADRRLDPAEAGRQEALVALLHQVADVYLAGIRATVRG